MNRYILVNENGLIIGVRFGKTPVEGEIESEQGEVGQQFVNGKFINVPVEPQPPVETTAEKIARLEQLVQEQNLTQMEVLATIYEEILGGA